jgi:hypothetical protein
MADEVAALKEPLVESSVRAKLLIDEVHKATTEMAGNLASIPAMTEALAEIAKRQIAILEQVQSTAKSLYTALYSKDPKHGFTQTSPEAADREYEIQRRMEEFGMSRAAAEEESQRDRMLDGFRVTR